MNRDMYIVHWLALVNICVHCDDDINTCMSVNACDFSCMSFFGGGNGSGAASCLRLSGPSVLFL